MIKDLKDNLREYLKEKRIENMNERIEAIQTINPLTSEPYLESNYPKVRKLEDPIQSNLRAMENRNPSTNEHRQGLLKTLTDRLSLTNRALQYLRGELEIFKSISRNQINLNDNIIYCFDFDKLDKIISNKEIDYCNYNEKLTHNKYIIKFHSKKNLENKII